MIRERLQYNTCHKQIFMPSRLIVNGPRVAVHKGPFRCPRCRTDSEELLQNILMYCRGCNLGLQRVGDLLEISEPLLTGVLKTTEPETSTSKPPDPTDSNPPEGKDDPGKGKSDPKGKKKGA